MAKPRVPPEDKKEARNSLAGRVTPEDEGEVWNSRASQVTTPPLWTRTGSRKGRRSRGSVEKKMAKALAFHAVRWAYGLTHLFRLSTLGGEAAFSSSPGVPGRSAPNLSFCYFWVKPKVRENDRNLRLRREIFSSPRSSGEAAFLSSLGHQPDASVSQLAKGVFEGEELWSKIFHKGWNGKTLNKKRIKATAKALSSAAEMQEITSELRGDFSRNVYHFSAAKNYHELRELSEAVYDPKTRQKTSFKEFKAIAQNINAQYNKIWLKTEQNFSYGATLMAKKWEGFEEEDMLQYKTMADGAVRDSHQALHNIIKPKNDPFWNSCYPPNGWGCRCNVIPTNSEEETKHTPPITEKVLPRMFRINPAKQGVIFPKNHTYFNKLPQEAREEVLEQARAVRKEVEREERNRLQEQLKQKLWNKTTHHPKLKKPIVITARGIKKTLWQPHKHQEDKLALLENILKEIPQAEFLGTAKSDKVEEQGKVIYHYLKVLHNNRVSYVSLMEKLTNDYITFYTIKDDIKQKNKS